MVVKKLNKKVLFLDSGIGGLALMHSCFLAYPYLDFIYFADYQNLPYGNKNAGFLRSKLAENISQLQRKFGFDAVVLACNTATSVAIKYLRKTLPKINFIGVEPAVNLAKNLRYQRILVLATQNTILHNRLLKNMMLDPNIRLYLQPMPRLAQCVERNFGNLDICVQRNEPVLARFCGEVDCVVLGCTHYHFLLPALEKYFNLPILDGNDGVVRHLGEFVSPSAKLGKVFLLSSDAGKLEKLEQVWQILSQKEE